MHYLSLAFDEHPDGNQVTHVWEQEDPIDLTIKKPTHPFVADNLQYC